MQFILFLNKAFHWHVFLSFMYATFRLCQYTFKTDMKLNELMKRNREDISRSLNEAFGKCVGHSFCPYFHRHDVCK